MSVMRPLVALLLLLCYEPLSPAISTAHELSLFLGSRFPHDESGYPIGTQPELGLRSTYHPSTWPIGIDAYISGSYGDQDAMVFPPGDDFMSGKFRAITFETGLGVRKEWPLPGVRPYLSAGLAYAQVQLQARTVGWRGSYERYDAIGPWAGVGITWQLGDHTRLGISGRFSAIDDKRDDPYTGAVSGGGTHIGVHLAWASRAD